MLWSLIYATFLQLQINFFSDKVRKKVAIFHTFPTDDIFENFWWIWYPRASHPGSDTLLSTRLNPKIVHFLLILTNQPQIYLLNQNTSSVHVWWIWDLPNFVYTTGREVKSSGKVEGINVCQTAYWNGPTASMQRAFHQKSSFDLSFQLFNIRTRNLMVQRGWG